MTPDTPFWIRRSMLAWVARKSIDPSSRNFVVTAGKTPVHLTIRISFGTTPGTMGYRSDCIIASNI